MGVLQRAQELGLKGLTLGIPRNARLSKKLTRDDLRNALLDFAAEFPEFREEKGATNSCAFASDQFLHHLSDQYGYEATIRYFDFALSSGRKEYPLWCARLDWEGYANHWVVRINNLYIDWTARQFDRFTGVQSPFPFLWTKRKRDDAPSPILHRQEGSERIQAAFPGPREEA